MKNKGILFESAILIGGEKGIDEELLYKCEIIVGTPGRLYEVLFEKKIQLNFGDFEFLILDEADWLIESEL